MIKNMSSKVLASRSKYYIGFLIFFIGIPLIAYLVVGSMPVSDIMPQIIVSLCSITSFGWSFIYLNLFVYAEIDFSKSELLYGNLFREDEIALRQVRYLGKISLFWKVHSLRINGVKYFLISSLEIDHLLNH